MASSLAATKPPIPPLSTKSNTTSTSHRSRPEPNPLPSPPSPPTTKTPTFEQTKQLHARYLRSHFHHHFSSPSALLNSLISSYTKNNTPLAALHLYAHARNSLHAALDSFTVPTVLKACALCSNLRQGSEVHGFAVKLGLDCEVFVHNSLMRMYSDCGDLGSAVMVFDEMPDRDVVSWSTMIRSCGRSGCFSEAVGLMREMLLVGVTPGEIAMINMINVLADAAALETGRQVHALMTKNRNVGPSDVNICTALIDMYVKCGCLEMGRSVFDRMVQRSTASWTAMIDGYVRRGDFGVALEFLGGMVEESVKPNEITMLSLVSNCGVFRKIGLGKWLHAYMLRNRLEMSIALSTALLDMYCKCGDNKSARALFDSMLEKDVMSWSVMISGYSQANCFCEAFELFWQMMDFSVKPNEITMVNLLSLCAEAGALDRGRWLHAFIEQQGIEIDIILATSLVNMYAKCGEMDGAYSVFNGTADRDVCMWNAMFNGLAMNGRGNEAIGLFSQMEFSGIRPNGISFVGILKACSHAGLVVEGKQFFQRMQHGFGLVPRVEHYGCMVDLLGRAGLLDEAHDMIRRMPVAANVIIWRALIAACKVHKNLRLGELAASEILKLDPHDVGHNILLSNIYAAQGRWSDVAEVRRAMKDRGMKKAPAVSSIELNGIIHEFVMGDVSHPQIEWIHEMVSEMHRELKQAGHAADTSVVLLNIDEEEKKSTLCFHSEKLAIALGLINTEPRTPLRIVKNLRVCDDCHTASKLLSKIYNRVITVRDRNRYHHFAEGFCSCGDYW